MRDSPYIEPAINVAIWKQPSESSRLCALPLFPAFRLCFRPVCVQACIGFTKKQDNQIKQTCYAQASQIRAVRKKMCDIMSEEATKCDLKELVLKL